MGGGVKPLDSKDVTNVTSKKDSINKDNIESNLQDYKNSQSEKSQNATKTQNLNLENNQTKTNTRSVVGGLGGCKGGKGEQPRNSRPPYPPCERVDLESKELSNNIKESSEFVNSRSETQNVENKKDSIKLVNLDSNNVNIPTPLTPLRNGGGNPTYNAVSLENKVSLENAVSLENTESNSQNSKIVSKDSIKNNKTDSKNSQSEIKNVGNKADSKNLQNLDSIESNNLSPTHRPILEKDSNKNIESNKFKNYQIHNFTHPNNQNFITFTMPSNATPPTQISYKTHFKITFLLKLLQYYLTGIAIYIFAKLLYKNLSQNIESTKTQNLDSKNTTKNAFILSVLSILLCVILLYNGHNWGGDFSQYIAQGRALTQGSDAIKTQIANNTFMIQKSDVVLGAYIYPWGFPLLLAPVIKFAGLNLIALKCVGIATFAMFIFIFHIFISRLLTQKFAITATLLFTLNPMFLDFTNSILSDIPFMLFNFLAVIMLSRLFKNPIDSIESKATFSYILFASLFATFAYLIRNNGVVIMLSLLALHALLSVKILFKIKAINIESNAKLWLHFLPYLIFFSLVFLTNKMLGSGGSGHLGFMLEYLSWQSIFDNFKSYSLMFRDFFGMPRDVVKSLGLIVYILGVICAVRGFRRAKNYFFLCVFFAHLALLILWPFQQGVRFIFALFPFLILWAFVGLDSMNLRAKKTANILFTLVFVFSLYKGIEIFRANSLRVMQGAFEPKALQMYDFIRENTPTDSIIIFSKPRVLYLTTGRLGFYSTNLERLKEADFLLIANEMPILESSVILELLKSGEITQIRENERFSLYKITK
ncbi:hypothetical protein [Helicobacter saguini]|uniref:Glycosyltransferase RgtA/B/C/D-like domain-containing protein n=1 Tax=Helicobacter saguini TaxID=1548018 RepID=A0A6L7DF62_9HELI|nr:hypothetical protein [Helicobacter saguini]MWV68936.1 hypothetical protein [Helicobacter saguini]